MKILFESNLSSKPLVSIILLDWKCRESFHIFNYLRNQTVPREQYEVIWIEYYNRRPAEIEEMLKEGEEAGKLPIVDKWIVMEIPDDLYYHKHLMYNVGIVASKGQIITICDSDGIVKPGFVETIIKSFEEDGNIVLHMDEVRNKDRRFYPFNFPSVEEITGDGCINYKDGKTTGLLDKEDPIHSLNYGSCMSALREDLINIGGADEHIDYLGHVCGPYEMTYRLVNTGKKEVWHQEEFLYHVWHPGTDGDDNYSGPHDGLNMSTTALEVRHNGRVLPLVENKGIRSMRTNHVGTYKMHELINPTYLNDWTHESMNKSSKFKKLYHFEFTGSYKNYNLLKGHKLFYAIPQILGRWNITNEEQRHHPLILSAETRKELEKQVDQVSPYMEFVEEGYNGYYILIYRSRFYALDHTLGQVDLTRDAERLVKEHQEDGKCIVGSSLSEVRKLVDKFGPAIPELTEENYKGFNILSYRAEFYALNQSLGHIDLTQDAERLVREHREDGKCIVGSSLSEVRKLVDKFGPIVPELVEEGYRGFNVILYRGKFYALSLSLGGVDITQTDNGILKEYQERGECMIGSSLHEAKRLVLENELGVRDKQVKELTEKLGELSGELLGIKSTRWFRIIDRIKRLRRMLPF